MNTDQALGADDSSWTHRRKKQWTCMSSKHKHAPNGWRNDLDRETCVWKCRRTGEVCGAPRPPALCPVVQPVPPARAEIAPQLLVAGQVPRTLPALADIFKTCGTWTCAFCKVPARSKTSCMECLRPRFDADTQVQEGVNAVVTVLHVEGFLPAEVSIEGCARFMLNNFQFDVEATLALACLLQQMPTLRVQELVHWVRVTVADVSRSLHIKLHQVRPLLLQAATEMQASRTFWTLNMVHDRCFELHSDPHQECLIIEMTELLLNESEVRPMPQQEISPWQKACSAIAKLHDNAQHLGYFCQDTGLDNLMQEHIECICCLEPMHLKAAGKNNDHCRLSCGCGNVCSACAETLTARRMQCPHACGSTVQGYFPFP